MKQLSETDVAATMITWLESMRWDVYQEVTIGGSVADIVATQQRLVWIVEAKTSFGMAVLGQAWEWRLGGFAHYVSCVTPARKTHAGGRLEREMLDYTGIGLHYTDVHSSDIRHVHSPKLFRNPPDVDRVRSTLRPEHKTFAKAGTSSGARWTPFVDTCDQLRRFVAQYPGCSLKEAICQISHHYRSASTAQSSMRHWIEKGIVGGVEIRRDGKKLSLHPTVSVGGVS